jgi:hypothetical protein
MYYKTKQSKALASPLHDWHNERVSQSIYSSRSNFSLTSCTYFFPVWIALHPVRP